ncbi:MAG TPA: VOC family protein [bacterium]|nr:VOC family protein [bacterium]
MNISFVTVHVPELDKTIVFYETVMGFTVARRFKAGPQVEIVFMADGRGAQIEFITGTGHTVNAKGLSIGFEVPDIEATHAHLKAHGVPIIYGPATMPSGVKLLNAKDPNGLELGFVQYPK